ncbi:MAG TPA: GntR family transcriptional regulator [Pseudonocardiaceae bacterium]
MPAQPELVANDALAPASLVELAVQRLRSEILSGALVPGERLIEEQLTRRFGTSRAPLREALRLLGQQGLVEHLPRRGVRVTELSPQDVDELFSLRDVLERFAVQAAPPVPDPMALVELANQLDAMRQAAATGAALEQAKAHRQFHVALVAMAGHRHLLLVYEPVIFKLQLYMAANLRREAQVGTPQDGVRRHQRLFDAVAGGDVDAVLATLSDHGARSYLP